MHICSRQRQEWVWSNHLVSGMGKRDAVDAFWSSITVSASPAQRAALGLSRISFYLIYWRVMRVCRIYNKVVFAFENRIYYNLQRSLAFDNVSLWHFLSKSYMFFFKFVLLESHQEAIFLLALLIWLKFMVSIWLIWVQGMIYKSVYCCWLSVSISHFQS